MPRFDPVRVIAESVMHELRQDPGPLEGAHVSGPPWSISAKGFQVEIAKLPIRKSAATLAQMIRDMAAPKPKAKAKKKAAPRAKGKAKK